MPFVALEGTLLFLEVSFLLEDFYHDGNWISGVNDYTCDNHDYFWGR